MNSKIKKKRKKTKTRWKKGRKKTNKFCLYRKSALWCRLAPTPVWLWVKNEGEEEGRRWKRGNNQKKVGETPRTPPRNSFFFFIFLLFYCRLFEGLAILLSFGHSFPSVIGFVFFVKWKFFLSFVKLILMWNSEKNEHKLVTFELQSELERSRTDLWQ